jgi:hypothetical protein
MAAVATMPPVLNLVILLVASMVLEDWMMGFLILALELFVFLANCEMMSAVSTSLWNVDLQRELTVCLEGNRLGGNSTHLLLLLFPAIAFTFSLFETVFGSGLGAFLALFVSCFDFFGSLADRDNFNFSSPNSPFSCHAASFCEHALQLLRSITVSTTKGAFLT